MKIIIGSGMETEKAFHSLLSYEHVIVVQIKLNIFYLYLLFERSSTFYKKNNKIK